jgi:hypothetical protein
MKNGIVLLFCCFTLSICISCKQSPQTSGNIPVFEKKNTLHRDTIKQEVSIYMDSLIYTNRIKSLANGDTSGLWPVKLQPLPLKKAILPESRIIAYYGNLYSKKMGVLGEYTPDKMWKMLQKEMENWQNADSITPVIPALHYIAVVAQHTAGKDGMYRFRMPASQIDSVLRIAEMQPNTLVFLDIQVGLSTIQKELPLLEAYLKLPNVHLGLDPEFSMKDGSQPGRKMGTFDAADINYCSEYLANLVQEFNLPPKVFVIHRFTKKMLTNYQNIQLRPEVQIVVNMDGWGAPYLKFATHNRYIYREPVQFTGFKFFYKNDIKNPPHQFLTPEKVLTLQPQPIYIQYQ